MKRSKRLGRRYDRVYAGDLVARVLASPLCRARLAENVLKNDALWAHLPRIEVPAGEEISVEVYSNEALAKVVFDATSKLAATMTPENSGLQYGALIRRMMRT